MAKLRLRMDDLAVETFASDEMPDARGTVHLHDASGVSCTYNCTLDEPSCGCPTFPLLSCRC